MVESLHIGETTMATITSTEKEVTLLFGYFVVVVVNVFLMLFVVVVLVYCCSGTS